MSQPTVQLLTADLFPGLIAFGHTLGNKLFDKRIAHIGHRRLSIRIHFLFHLSDNVIDNMKIARMDRQSFLDQFITFYQT